MIGIECEFIKKTQAKHIKNPLKKQQQKKPNPEKERKNWINICDRYISWNGIFHISTMIKHSVQLSRQGFTPLCSWADERYILKNCTVWLYIYEYLNKFVIRIHVLGVHSIGTFYIMIQCGQDIILNKI